jgi:hypothetical protein
VSNPIIFLLKAYGSKLALNCANSISEAPLYTPHSTIEPFTGKTALNSSYLTRYLTKFYLSINIGKSSTNFSGETPMRNSLLFF